MLQTGRQSLVVDGIVCDGNLSVSTNGQTVTNHLQQARAVDDCTSFAICRTLPSVPTVLAVDTIAGAGIGKDFAARTLHACYGLNDGSSVLQLSFVGMVLQHKCHGVVILKAERQTQRAVIVNHTKGIHSVPYKLIDIGQQQPWVGLVVGKLTILNFHFSCFHIIVFNS